jgi:hypothetical protein
MIDHGRIDPHLTIGRAQNNKAQVQQDLIDWVFLRVGLLSQICLGFHRTRSDIGPFWWILSKKYVIKRSQYNRLCGNKGTDHHHVRDDN